MISAIDATGKSGDQLTKKGNTQDVFSLSTSDLLGVLNEEGQILELDASLIECRNEVFKIMIRDGISVDVLGSGEVLPLSVIGKYTVVENSWFLWDLQEGRSLG